MSGTQPYFDTEPDLPVDVEGRVRPPARATCLLCGFEATNAEIWLKPAWWREPGPDGKFVTTLPRCLDTEACRARVTANGEPWLLLERGEQPDRPRRPDPPRHHQPQPLEPMDSPAPPAPDEEVAHVRVPWL
jgi:hypothetical protein